MVVKHPIESVPIEFLKGDRGRMVRLRKCACGCGKNIPSKNRNGSVSFAQGHHWRGRHRTGEKRNQRAGKNNNWKGGAIVTPEGYAKIRAPSHPRALKRGKYVREHIIVMEKHLGRHLLPGEIVHHLNGVKDDNRIENLLLTTQEEHSRMHRKTEISEGKPLFGRP